jgi:hypothetical protein
MKVGITGPKNESKESLVISYKPVNSLNLNNNINKTNTNKLSFKDKKISIKNKTKIREFLKNTIIKELNFLIYNIRIIKYYYSYKNWLINYRLINNKIIYIISGEKCKIPSQGNILIKI